MTKHLYKRELDNWKPWRGPRPPWLPLDDRAKMTFSVTKKDLPEQFQPKMRDGLVAGTVYGYNNERKWLMAYYDDSKNPNIKQFLRFADGDIRRQLNGLVAIHKAVNNDPEQYDSIAAAAVNVAKTSKFDDVVKMLRHNNFNLDSFKSLADTELTTDTSLTFDDFKI